MLQPTVAHARSDVVGTERDAVLALFQIVRASLQMSPADRVDVGAKRLLATLAESGSVRPSDLAAKVKLDLSTVSRHLASLERQGLASRSQDEADRRACHVDLTPQGRELLAEMLDHRVASIAPVLREWDDADRDRLCELLVRLAADMRARSHDPFPTGEPR